MTIAIGLHLGSYIMLAADTRVTWHAFGMDISHRDDSEKIRRTNVGIITGAGWVDLLDSVKSRMANEHLVSTNDLIRTIREERARLAPPPGIDPAKVTNFTGWIFSYTTEIDSQFKLRLAMSHPSISEGKEIALYKEGELAMIAPAEATETQASTISNLLRENMRKPLGIPDLADSAKLQNHISHHWLIVAAAIKGLQPNFKSISDKVQIGVHLLSGARGVSDISSLDNPNFTLSLTA